MWVNKYSWTVFLTFLRVHLKNSSQRPSIKSSSVVANPVSRNSPDSNYSVGWPFHTSITHNLQRIVAPPRPHTSPLTQHRVNSSKPQHALCSLPKLLWRLCLYSDCCSFMPLMHNSHLGTPLKYRHKTSHTGPGCVVWVCFLFDVVTLWFIQLSDTKPSGEPRLTTFIGRSNVSQTLCIWWVEKSLLSLCGQWRSLCWIFPMARHLSESASVGWGGCWRWCHEKGRQFWF